MTLLIVLWVIVWLGCGALTAGIAIAHFQNAFPTIAEKSYRSDVGFAVMFGLIGGPLWLFVALCMTGFCQYGFGYGRLKNSRAAQRERI